jgi:hypothetical protein
MSARADHEAGVSLLREAFGNAMFSTHEAMAALAVNNGQQSEIMDILFDEAKRLHSRIKSVGDDPTRGFLFRFA